MEELFSEEEFVILGGSIIWSGGCEGSIIRIGCCDSWRKYNLE